MKPNGAGHEKLSTALYEQMLDEDFTRLDIDRCLSVWKTLDEVKAETREMFKNTDFPDIGETEMEEKYVDKEGLRRQLTSLKDNWIEIREKLRHQLIPYSKMRKSLQAAGAPVLPEQIGITRERLSISAVRAQRIRHGITQKSSRIIFHREISASIIARMRQRLQAR